MWRLAIIVEQKGIAMIARRSFAILLLLIFCGSLSGFSEQLTFQHALELALTHSPQIGLATADQMKAQAALEEIRSSYKPNVGLGSGLGWSYGFPMTIEGSAPSIFQVNYQSALLNFSLRDFAKSAKLEVSAVNRTGDDQRKDVIVDVALAYIQLDNIVAELKSLRDQETEANKLTDIVNQRVQQGIDSQLESTRAQLLSARVHLRITELEGNADVLREKLGKATGLAPQAIETSPESIPKFPSFDQQADLATKALDNSNSVKAAAQRAEAQEFRARGEHRALLPSLDIVGQYGLFAKFNNYEDFFRKFQRNNATMGVAVKFPIFNFVQRSHAEQADADALKAKKQVEVVKNQVSEETLRLQRAVRQLGAAQRVAQLEYELAQSQAQATQIRAESGAAAPQTPDAPTSVGAVTARDVASARLQAGDRYSQYMSSTFEYDKARLQLLRLTGDLENWAGTAK